MKKRFFKFIEIDQEIIKSFLSRHEKMKEFIDPSKPFYVRVGIKLYPTLIHTIICDQEANDVMASKLALFANELNSKISPRKVNKIQIDKLISILGDKKAQLIKNITSDIISRKLNLKSLAKANEIEIQNELSKYANLSLNAIKTFTLFGCFKQNVLLNEEKEFNNGLKIYFKKDNILQEDIDNISIEYANELTLFSLCMFRIVNEKAGK